MGHEFLQPKAMWMMLLKTRKCFTHVVSKYVMEHGCKICKFCGHTTFNFPFMFHVVISFRCTMKANTSRIQLHMLPDSYHSTTYITAGLRIVSVHYLQQPLNLINERSHLAILRGMIG